MSMSVGPVHWCVAIVLSVMAHLSLFASPDHHVQVVAARSEGEPEAIWGLTEIAMSEAVTPIQSKLVPVEQPAPPPPDDPVEAEEASATPAPLPLAANPVVERAAMVIPENDLPDVPERPDAVEVEQPTTVPPEETQPETVQEAVEATDPTELTEQKAPRQQTEQASQPDQLMPTQDVADLAPAEPAEVLRPLVEPAEAVEEAETTELEPVETRDSATPRAAQLAAPLAPIGRQTGDAVVEEESNTAGQEAFANFAGQIASHLSRHKRFPDDARRARGVVRITFTVLEDGSVTGIAVAESSGNAVLDRAAVAMVRRAEPFPEIPAEMARRTARFTVPIRFSK